LVPGSVLGIAAAWVLASHVSNAAIELSVGTIGLCFVLHTWVGAWFRPFLEQKPPELQQPQMAMGFLWGSLAGFMSTLVQVGTPPYQIHILPQRLDKLTLVGTTVIFFALMNLMKIVPYFALDQFSPRTVSTSLALLPLAVATNFLGIWLVQKTSTEQFYRIAYFLMLFISLTLLWQGWKDLGS